ncbi:MAG: hypothetical protein KDE04_24020, partial [Anaerolineales bacterium]|nr:hypothetical protein [Anaerolineales bacterium]
MSADSALALANARLLRLRAERQLSANTASTAATAPIERPANPTPPWEKSTATSTTIDAVLALPDHLGWGSAAASQAIRRAQANQQRRAEASRPLTLRDRDHAIDAPSTMGLPAGGRAATTPASPRPNTHIPISPDIAFGMLRQGLASQGRLWYLMRHLDEAGR